MAPRFGRPSQPGLLRLFPSLDQRPAVRALCTPYLISAILEAAYVPASSHPRKKYLRRSTQRLARPHSATHEYSPANYRPEIIPTSSSLHSAQPGTLPTWECHRCVLEAAVSQLERH